VDSHVLAGEREKRFGHRPLYGEVRSVGEAPLNTLFGDGREPAPDQGKNSPSSRSALSGESDPCTRFSVTTRPKSPRIVPGAASSGLVAPMMARATPMAPSPDHCMATTGPEVMKASNSGKNGFSTCSA